MKFLQENRKLKFVFISFGIFSCYATFGVLQEKIFCDRYGHEVGRDGEIGEQFNFPVAFVTIECIVHALFAKGISQGHSEKFLCLI